MCEYGVVGFACPGVPTGRRPFAALAAGAPRRAKSATECVQMKLYSEHMEEGRGCVLV